MICPRCELECGEDKFHPGKVTCVGALKAQLDEAKRKRAGDANTIHQLRLNADDWHDERAELRAALGLDQPWSVAHVLRRLADAAEHLLDVHDCDAHGWEEVRGCVERARSYAKLLEVACSKGAPE